MKKTFVKKITTAALALVGSALPIITFASVASNRAAKSLEQASVNAGFDTNNNLIAQTGTFLNGALVLMGVFFMALIFFGGNIWMAARGNEEEITRAKKIISAASIGFIAVIVSRSFAEIIIKFLVSPFIQ